ncbi:MAG TPA: diphthine--ammonia ligase [Dehalococcoidales bacterium]|nr:diphthine--ammonia ligase [Dehalococcoidales bacterium]
MKVVASWSGGKDGCFACFKALEQGYEVSHLVNFISREFRRVSFHGTKAHLIQRQAQAIGIPLAQYTVPPDMSLYEQTFKKAVSVLKRSGVEGMVFGDIYLDEHRDWIERVCGELGITPILPLWDMTPEHVLNDFVEAGFEAIVVSARANIFDREWLGRKIDRSFLVDIKNLQQKKELDICGESGEYHTFVVDGPLFAKRIRAVYGVRMQRNGLWFLDIPRCRLELK